MASYNIDKCLCCGSSQLQLILDLGVQPPANHYRKKFEDQLDVYPLGLNICNNCWHSQLNYCVDRGSLFQDYTYVSGTSSTLYRFFTWFADCLASALPAQAKVLELAANDGSLIREMEKKGLNCIGVDPAHNIVSKAQEENLPVIEGFWPEVKHQLADHFDAIICMNVVAHVDDPLNFLIGCKEKLSAHGMIIVQTSQARMFSNSEFDTIYHEHISFFNTKSMSRLAERAGLKLVDAFMVKVHGDSPVYVLQHENEETYADIKSYFANGEFAIDEELYSFEEKAKLYNSSTYKKFRDNAEDTKSDLVKTIDDYRQRGYDIVFVGAAAKAMTVINAADILVEHFFDENPMKIGLYPPVGEIRIEALENASQLSNKALFIISAWNFRYELVSKLRNIGVPSDSIFYSYFPFPEIISN